MKNALLAAALLHILCSAGLSQSTDTPEGLKQYVPVLPSVRKQFFVVDPKLG
jgi:hypothetical protein